MSSARRWFYRCAQFLGDVEAAEHGSFSYGKSRVRRVAYRKWNWVLRRGLRRGGLG